MICVIFTCDTSVTCNLLLLTNDLSFNLAHDCTWPLPNVQKVVAPIEANVKNAVRRCETVPQNRFLITLIVILPVTLLLSTVTPTLLICNTHYHFVTFDL